MAEMKLCSALVPKGPCMESLGPRVVWLGSVTCERPLVIRGLVPKEDYGPSRHFIWFVACDANS